jgi:hypothetical protein
VRLALACACTLAAAGCAARGADAAKDGGVSDAPSPTDSNGVECTLGITFDRTTADPIVPIRAMASVSNAPGVLTYTWTVTQQGGSPVTFEVVQPDGSAIAFLAPTPMVYSVELAITGAAVPCVPLEVPLNVTAPGANAADYRLHVVPPSLPPQDQLIQVVGGADFHYTIALAPGVPETVLVSNGVSGIPAYVRISPVGSALAAVEGFSASDGTLDVQLLDAFNDVVVVPAVPGVAPKRFAQWKTGTTSLVLGAGTAISGTVKDPAGAALAGAKVQLSSGGLPSTLATTDAGGGFTVLAQFPPNAQITASVTPPSGRGLPVLEATAAFAGVIQIRYASSLATCDLAATPIRRAGIAQPNAAVTVVGTLAGVAGTVTAGVMANATGTVRVAATAGATGSLGSVLVPRAPLAAIVEVAPGDVALSALDTSTCTAQVITAPAMTVVGGTVDSLTAVPLRGVAIEATPTGALAGLPPVQTTSAAGGGYSLSLVTGGRYDLRFVDPSGAGAPLVLLGTSSAAVPAVAMLPKAIHAYGSVTVSSMASPVPGASIQLMCATCTGIDALRPLAEATTGSTSQYVLTVPDPGTM